MSGSRSTSGQGVSIKLVHLNKHTKHQHRPSPVSPGFVAPPVISTLSFSSIALAAAVARTATTWNSAPSKLLYGLHLSALAELKTLLQSGSDFALESYFGLLADTARSQFAAKVGAGIAHLYMEALGYTWRANAACLSASFNPHADFIYGGGNTMGIGAVLAEAHGSFAKATNAAKIHNKAKSKYIRQVKPFLTATSPFGKIVHGYSIAFGSNPSAKGAFLSVSETRIPKPRKRAPLLSVPRKPPSAGATPSHLALATHRSNFLLLGAYDVTDWIDWVLLPDRAAPEKRDVAFLRINFDGRSYLLLPHPQSWQAHTFWNEQDLLIFLDWWQVFERERLLQSPYLDPRHGWFAIEENAGASFLNALSGAIRDARGSLTEDIELPNFDPVGIGMSEPDNIASSEAGELERYALFRDGLALLADPLRAVPRDVVVWSPDDGIELGR